MELLNYIKETVTTPPVLLAVAIIMSVIEVVPIKIYPWSKILKWVGKAINGDLLKKLESVETDIATIKRDQEEEKAENMRDRILTFASSCRRHEKHDSEEWNNIISQLRKYEQYVEDRGIENGVIEENAVYLRELYHDRLVKNDFE